MPPNVLIVIKNHAGMISATFIPLCDPTTAVVDNKIIAGINLVKKPIIFPTPAFANAIFLGLASNAP